MRITNYFTGFLLALLVLALSPAPTKAQSLDTVVVEFEKPRPTMNRVTQAEMNATVNPVLYDALVRVRPSILRNRGGSDRLVVEIDGVRMHSVDALRHVRTADVEYVVRDNGVSVVNGQTLLRVRTR